MSIHIDSDSDIGGVGFCAKDDSARGYVKVAPTTKTDRARCYKPTVHIPKTAPNVTTDPESGDELAKYTTYINLWINAHYICSDSGKYKRAGYGSETTWLYEREIETEKRVIKATAVARSLTMARHYCSRILYSRIVDLHYQSDESPKESVQGLAIQASDKSSNTIVTRDEGRTETTVKLRNECSDFASSEPAGMFEMLTSRWMPLDAVEVTTSKALGDLLMTWYLPESLFKIIPKSANLLPFETFIYGEFDITFKFVVNANKFQCGKVLASCKFDSYQAESNQLSVQSALHRPHVMLDLASNNEGNLHVPFRYHRALVRLSSKGSISRAIRARKYASVYMHVLSPLRTGTDAATNMYIRPFVSITRAKFCGISYRVDLQMEGLGGAVASLATGAGNDVLRRLLSGAEALLKDTSSTPNRDKPTDNRALVIIPRPRLNFPTGKGPTDALPLRMDPTASTAYSCIQPYPDDPKNVLEIARIWGLRSTFEWAASATPGSVLESVPIDPSTRSYISGYSGVPTPLEYITSLYGFWSGTIEMRFDFISNMYHTGSVQISVEFGRPTVTASSEKESASAYTKTFHLGEQKSCHITVPYIYDTVWRRSCSLPWNPVLTSTGRRGYDRKYSTAVFAQSRTYVTIRVINELRPVQTAPQTIDVLIYWRASPSYRVHSLKQSAFYFTNETQGLVGVVDDFPRNYTIPAQALTDPATPSTGTTTTTTTPAPSRRKRQVNDGDGDGYDDDDPVGAGRYLPGDEANSENEEDPDALQPLETSNLPNQRIDDQQPPADDIQYEMDSGEKEDQDSTQDFKVGIPALEVQTNDPQLNIKDILRRPVLLFNRVELTGLDQSAVHGFFIPLRPPSRNFGRSGSKSSYYNDLVTQTPQAQLMSLFRFWRGSMRYTIIIHDLNPEPVYITHMPHSGITLTSNSKVMFQDNVDSEDASKSFERPIYGCGLSSEMLIPSVNQTIQVEAPYDTENNWTLTFEYDNSRAYSWRDKTDTNAGHLVITSRITRTMTVWWSAGDDFEVANFWGIPNCVSNQPVEAFYDIVYQNAHDSDSEYEDALDFRVEDSRDASRVVRLKQQVLGLAGKYPTATGVAKAALVSQIPIIGPGYAAYRALQTADRVDVALSDVAKTTSQTQVLLDAATKCVSTANDAVQGLYEAMLSALSKVSGLLTTAVEWRRILEDILFDLASALVLQSWQVAASSVTRLFLRSVGIHNTVGALTDVVVGLAKWFNENISWKGCVSYQVSQDELNTSKLVGLLAGLVGLALNVTIAPHHYSSLVKQYATLLTSTKGMSYLNSTITLFTNIFTLLKDLTCTALGLVSPEAQALKLFSSSSPLIEKFITDAQMVTSECNTSMLALPQYRTKFWLTVTNAYQIQSVLCRLPSNVASPPLARLCADVIKHANERMVDLSACPVRFEPFVMCVTGAPGIGKSHLNDTLCSKLLAAIDFARPSSGIVYVRQPGSKYWSGYRDQPVITYDDMFNLNSAEHITQSLSELYQLKSPCVFIPEMASLEEKRIKGNPLIVTWLCNDAFPRHIQNVAVNTEAVWRRRDILIRAELAPGWTVHDIPKMTKEQSEAMAHLLFQIHSNPRNPHAAYFPEKYTWAQLVDHVSRNFNQYYQTEVKKTERRVRELQSYLMNIPPEKVNLEDPFKLFYDAQHKAIHCEPTEFGWVPSEQLLLAVREAAQVIEQKYTLSEPDDAPPSDDITHENRDDRPNDGLAWFRSFLKKIPYATERCVNCQQRTITPVCCLSPEQPHYYCAACAHDANPKLCVSCGIGIGKLTISTVTLRALKGISYILDCASREYSAILEACNSADPTTLVRLVQFCMLANVIASTLNVKVPFTQLGVGWYAWWVYRRPAVHSLPPGGDLCAIEPLQRPTARQILEEIKSVGPNMDNFFHYIQDARETTTCFHDLLIDAASDETLVYIPDAENPRWRVLVELNGEHSFVEIVDRPCSNALDCKLRHQKSVKEFYETVARAKRDWLSERMASYLSNYNGHNIIRESVPLMLRRPWMCPPKYVGPKKEWWEYLSDKWIQYRELISILGTTVACFGIVYSGYKLFEYCSSPQQPAISQRRHQADIYEAERIQHLRRVHKNVRVTGERKNVRHQSDNHHFEVRNLVRANYVTLLAWSGDMCVRSYGMLAVYGKVVIFPKHFFPGIQGNVAKGCKLTIELSMYMQGRGAGIPPNHTRHEYTFDPADFVLHPTTDLGVFKLPKSFQSFRDIRRHFVRDEDLTTYLPNVATLELVPTKKRPFIDGRSVNIFNLEPEVYLNPNEGCENVIRDVVSYDYSEDGVCGSALILERSQRPILSIHTAGASGWNMGYGTLVTQELLTEFVPQEVVYEMEQCDFESVGDREDAFLLGADAKVHYLGCVPKGQEHFSPPKSKIRKSLIHDVGPLTHYSEPTILSSKDPRYVHPYSPLFYGARKHGIRTRDFTTTQVRRAADAYFEGWLRAMRPCVVDPKLLTYNEAVTGLDGVEFYDPMKLNTSAGYPWVLKRSDTTKEAWIDVTRDESGKIVSVRIDPEVLAECERKQLLRQHGRQPLTIFADTLKDERKLIEKVGKAGATRVFCGSPIDYTLEVRRHLLHFCAAYMKARFNVMSGVGINAKGAEWTTLYHFLTKSGATKFVTLDYSNFGPAFNAQVAYGVVTNMCKWVKLYCPSIDCKVVEILLMECVNSVHIAHNTVYQQFSGSPSGAPTTTIFNSNENVLLILIAWDSLVSDYLRRTGVVDIWEEFRQHVRLVVYGDDVVMSVTDMYIDLFNMKTIQNFFREYGIVATGTDKELGEEPCWIPFEEVSFLKRSFIPHPVRPGMWLAPLKWTSVNDATQWIWSCADHREATLVNCRSALGEAHGHGPERYLEFRDQINAALTLVNMKHSCIMLTWEDLDNTYFPEFDIAYQSDSGGEATRVAWQGDRVSAVMWLTYMLASQHYVVPDRICTVLQTLDLIESTFGIRIIRLDAHPFNLRAEMISLLEALAPGCIPIWFPRGVPRLINYQMDNDDDRRRCLSLFERALVCWACRAYLNELYETPQGIDEIVSVLTLAHRRLWYRDRNPCYERQITAEVLLDVIHQVDPSLVTYWFAGRSLRSTLTYAGVQLAQFGSREAVELAATSLSLWQS